MNQQLQQLWSKKPFLLLLSFCALSAYTVQAQVAVAPSKMNVLYIGIDNPVSIAAANATDEQTTVAIEGGDGTIEKSSAGLYNVRVAKPSDQCVIKVFVDGKQVGTSNFRVRSLPTPMPTIGGYSAGEAISFAALQAQPGVGAYIKDFPFDVQYKITGFTLKVEDAAGNVKTADCPTALFTPEAKQLLAQHAKPGTSITLEKIRAMGPSEKESMLPVLVYRVK